MYSHVYSLIKMFLLACCVDNQIRFTDLQGVQDKKYHFIKILTNSLSAFLTSKMAFMNYNQDKFSPLSTEH